MFCTHTTTLRDIADEIVRIRLMFHIISPFLTEGPTNDSVALIMSGLCRLFSTSVSASFFLLVWQFMRMHRKFGPFFCLYVFLLLVVLSLVVLFEL